MLRMLPAACLLPAAAAHGNVVMPPSWFDADGSVGLTPKMQCRAGCSAGVGGPGCACEWYTNWTFIPGAATIADDSPLRTWGKTPYNDGGLHPWRAPGSAPIFSPCGVDGGNPDGCPVGSPGRRCSGGGYGHGPDARTLKGNTDPPAWAAGSAVDVAWAITANHGGGYSYRLCKKPAGGNMDLTEDCFQKGSLRFSGDTQWVQYGTDPSTRKPIPAMRTDVGTIPAGSQWTRNPIPACKGVTGGVLGTCSGPQFTPPLPGLYGFGLGFGGPSDFGFSVVDSLELPADLAPGAYVLSFRWDCEHTPQVWNSCADVRIVGAAPPRPAPPPPAARKYQCDQQQCVASAAGTDLAVCQAACSPTPPAPAPPTPPAPEPPAPTPGPPAPLYICIFYQGKNQCWESPGGTTGSLPRKECEATCAQSPTPQPPAPAPTPAPPAPTPAPVPPTQPPAPPSPHTPSAACAAALEQDCAMERATAAACAGCVTRNVRGLRAAGCSIQLGTHDDAWTWCHAAARS